MLFQAVDCKLFRTQKYENQSEDIKETHKNHVKDYSHNCHLFPRA